MRERSDQRVNSIIDAAINEFVEKGYAAASMESIAGRAGLSKGGLYHHFRSKAEILFSVNQRIMEPLIELAAQIESNPSLVDGLKQYIHDYLDYWIARQRELNLYFITMNEAFSNPQIMALYRELAKASLTYFGGLFQKGIDKGIFDHCDVHARAVAFISCLDGYLGYLLIDPLLDTGSVEKEIQRAFILDLMKRPIQ